jgi:hypothetical protein
LGDHVKRIRRGLSAAAVLVAGFLAVSSAPLTAATAQAGTAVASAAISDPRQPNVDSSADAEVSVAAPKPPGQPPMSEGAQQEAAEAISDAAPLAFQQTVRAVVTASGAISFTQSVGAVSAAKLAVGTYQVCFSAVINRGTYVASIGLPGNVGASPPGEITVVGRVTTTNCLFIQTYNSAGVLADRNFHVIVQY